MSLELFFQSDFRRCTLEEWKVLRDDKLYTDRFDSEDLAYEYIEVYCEYLDGEFTVEKMTEEEINSYY